VRSWREALDHAEVGDVVTHQLQDRYYVEHADIALVGVFRAILGEIQIPGFPFKFSAQTDLPNIEAARDAFPILGWELQPGDAVCFHMLTLHATRGVTGPHRRRVFSVRFLGDDITHAPRRWRTSPEFPGLSAVLPAGAPMNHELFPVLWRAT